MPGAAAASATPPPPPPPPPFNPPPPVAAPSPTHIFPAPVWGSINGHALSGTAQACNSPQTLQGPINPAQLQFTKDSGSMGLHFEYLYNNGTQTAWTSGQSIAVLNNDQLLFCVTQIGTGESLGNIVVTNVSDSNTVVATIPYDVYVGTPP